MSQGGHIGWRERHAMKQNRESTVFGNPSVLSDTDMLQAISTACEFRKTWQHMGVPSRESGAKTLLIIYSQVSFCIFKVSQKLSRLWVSPSVCVQLMQNQATREVRTMLARVVAQETNMRGNQSKTLAVNQRVDPRAWQQSNIKKIKAVKIKNSTIV